MKESNNKIFMKLELLEIYDDIYFSLEKLKVNGLKSAPQGPMRLESATLTYMEAYHKDYEDYLISAPLGGLKNSYYYKSFWDNLKIYIEKSNLSNNLLPLYKTSNHNWYDLSFGIQDYHLVFRCSKQKQEISIDFYIDNNKLLFEELLLKKSTIEHSYGHNLNWQKLQNQKACTIKYSKKMSCFIKYKDCFNWLVNEGFNLFNLIHQEIISSKPLFPECVGTETCIEGAKTTVMVNKYERSSVARQKCININGCYCHVCTLNFEKIYGDMGAGFIHVHHIIPLHQIDEQYIVDPINDLIPVCPNCHAMLHRQINGQYLSVEQLKLIIKTTKL